MGPWLVLKDQIKDPLNLNYKVLINNEIKQQANLNEYKNSPHLRSAPWYISSASQYFPLEIGSVILYGATEGTTKAVPKPGDTMRFELEGVGTLEIPVIAET